MTYKEIQDLIKLVGKTNLAEVDIKDGEFEIRIKSGTTTLSEAPVVIQAPQPAVPPSSVQPAAPPPVQEAAAPAAKEEKADADANYVAIKSPIVGTFYRSPSPDKDSFVKVGDSVDVGTVVCIVEAMKLFNEIESEVSGKIVKVLVDDASPIEYDQALFLVDPKG